MSSPRARPRSLLPVVLTAAAGALTIGCSSDPAPLHGSPVLQQVYWISGGQQLLAWSIDADPTLVSPLPPFASELDFVFDRRLDGNKIDNLVNQNGETVAVPMDPGAVRVTWDDMAAAPSVPPFHLVVDYNSIPRFGGVTSYLFARPDIPGFPASHSLTFTFVPTDITSAYDEIAVLPSSIPVITSAFIASIASTRSEVGSSYQFPLAFSNRLPPAPTGSDPHVHVRTAAGDVPYQLVADASLASRWYLQAAPCLGGWPAATTFEVTIDAAFPDAFGVPLGQPATATFSTSATGVATPDASCSVTPVDAGAGDTPTDAPAEAGADAGVVEPGPEAGAAEAGAPEGAPEAGGADAGVEAARDAPGDGDAAPGGDAG
jgi:hypothetical protein